MALTRVRKPSSYHFNDGSMGQDFSRYGDTRSHKAGFPSMSNYGDDGWPSGPKNHPDALYQEKPAWSSDVGFHDRVDHGGFSAPFHPGRAAGYSRYDTGAWHQTPGLSSGSGLGLGSRCPKCGVPSQGAMADEWGPNARDPYGQAQRRFSPCSNCGFVQTTAPYGQPAGTGPLSPADDMYGERSFDPFSNHHSRQEWQQRPGGGFDSQFNNNMAFPRSNSPMGTFDHHRQQRPWNQGSFPSSGAYDFQDSYPMMDEDPYGQGFGRQGFSSVGDDHPYGFPGMEMSNNARRGTHTPFPGHNLVTSYHYSKRVYLGGRPGGGMGSRPYPGEYDNDRW